MTYPLYLLHYTLGGAILIFGVDHGMTPATAVAVALSACVVAAAGVAVFLEPPLKRALDVAAGYILGPFDRRLVQAN